MTPYTKKRFGAIFSGTQFLALVHTQSTHGHPRYVLRWYTVTKTGSCVPGEQETFDDPRLQIIQNRASVRALWEHTLGVYTVGRPTWRTIDYRLLHAFQDDAIRYGSVDYERVIDAPIIRGYASDHDRLRDPFRQIWPGFDF